MSEEKDALLDEIEIYKSEEVSHISPEKIIHFVDMFEEAVAEQDNSKINNILCELIDQIIVDDEKIEIHWNF